MTVWSVASGKEGKISKSSPSLDYRPKVREWHVQDDLERPIDSHVVRVGSMYMLYALYHTQPKSHLIRVYVPLHLMRGLTWMAGQSADVALMLKKLHSESALVLGAVRRPISGTKEARLAGYPAKL